MINYLPDCKYFNWDIIGKIPSEHWQQLMRQIPYEEHIKFYKDNPQISHVIQEGTKCSP